MLKIFRIKDIDKKNEFLNFIKTVSVEFPFGDDGHWKAYKICDDILLSSISTDIMMMIKDQSPNHLLPLYFTIESNDKLLSFEQFFDLLNNKGCCLFSFHFDLFK